MTDELKTENEDKIWRRYPKIYRLGNTEVEGILDSSKLNVTEKIDGAQTSIFLKEGKIHFASRNAVKGRIDEDLSSSIKSTFRGFADYIKAHKGITELFKNYTDFILYGEWLVPHSITYDKGYNKFYLYDVYDYPNELWLDTEAVKRIAEEYDLPMPYQFFSAINDLMCPPLDEIKKCVGRSELGKTGEGVVIKSDTFINKSGDRCHAKIVTEKFTEVNKLHFGGNDKHLPTYNELKLMNKYCTEARVLKIMHKLKMEGVELGNYISTPRVVSSVYHDITDEIEWHKLRLVINFGELRTIICGRAAIMYKDIVKTNPKEWNYYGQ